MALRDFVHLQTVAGERIAVGAREVTPRAQALVIRLPHLMLVWNRPLDIQVEQQGVITHVPVRDFGRLAELALLALLVTVAIAAKRASKLCRE